MVVYSIRKKFCLYWNKVIQILKNMHKNIRKNEWSKNVCCEDKKHCRHKEQKNEKWNM